MKLFGQYIYAPILLLAVAEYGLAGLAFALAVSLLVRGGMDVVGSTDLNVIPWIFAFSTAVVVGLTAVGLYQPKQRLRLEGVIVRLIAALVLAVASLALVNLIYPLGGRAPLWLLSVMFTFGLLVAARVCFGQLVDHEVFRRRVLVYGAGDRAATLLKLRRRSDRRGFKIVGFIPAPGDRQVLDDPRVVVNNNKRLLACAAEKNVEEIVVAMDDRRSGFPIDHLLECRFNGIAVIDLLGFLERETGKVRVDLVNPAWLIFSESFSRRPVTGWASRALDLIVATLLALVSLPVMAVVAIAILVEDGRPILYQQKRVGLREKVFTLHKFRSMVKNAESPGSAQWADRADPRITAVGRVIRKLRVDELPQLLNVIRGDMSLVGPRPERPEFVEELSRRIPYYRERHAVKPGITGWAQLCYPYAASADDAMEKLQFDLYYVKHRTLAFDLMVLLQTVEVVLWSKGAR